MLRREWTATFLATFGLRRMARRTNKPSARNQTAAAGHRVLAGRGRKGALARLWPFLGPAFIASVAYIDPGNFATNIGPQLAVAAAAGAGASRLGSSEK
jgi:hypothetical protein